MNIPLSIALRGGSSWISGAAAKAMDHRTTSAPLVSTDDLKEMKVLQLEEGSVGPQREHIDFKTLIKEDKDKKEKKKKMAKDDDDADDEIDEVKKGKREKNILTYKLYCTKCGSISS